MNVISGRILSPPENRAATALLPPPRPIVVTFNRLELSRILNLYGRMVSDGEWRDYAIDFLRDRAVFSVFRRVVGSAALSHRERSATGAQAGHV